MVIGQVYNIVSAVVREAWAGVKGRNRDRV